MPNNIEKAREYLKSAKETAKGVVTSRWGIRTVVSSLMALGVLSSVDTAIAQPALMPYGIDACSPHGDDWRSERHRDVGFIFGGNEANSVLEVGRALTITDVREGRMIVSMYQRAGERASLWTTKTHGGAASVLPGEPPVMFREGGLYLAEVWETDDPKSIQMGGSSMALATFAGCEPLNQPQ